MSKIKITILTSILVLLSQSVSAQNNNSWAGSLSASLNLFTNIAGFSAGLNLGTNNTNYGYPYNYGYNQYNTRNNYLGMNTIYPNYSNTGFYQNPYVNYNLPTNGIYSPLNYNYGLNGNLTSNLYMNGYSSLPQNVYSNYTSKLCSQTNCGTALSANDVVYNASSQCVLAQVNSNLLSSTKAVQCQSANIQNITSTCLARTNAQYGLNTSINYNTIGSQIVNQQKSVCEWGSMSAGYSSTTGTTSASYLGVPSLGLQ